MSLVNYTDIQLLKSEGDIIGIKKVDNLEAIKNSLINLFLIDQGEVPGKPWLGNPLSLYVFDNIGFFEERSIERALINVLENYEPRVSLENLKVTKQPEYNSIEISIDYIAFIDNSEIFQSLSFSIGHNQLTNVSLRTQQL